MDKADFIKLAPAYYELAVLLAVWEAQRHLSEESIRREYALGTDDHDPEPETLLGSYRLLKNAIAALAARNVIAVLEDPFGPTLYERAEGINQHIEDLLADKTSPFYKASRAPNRTLWVLNALSQMNRIYNELAVTEAELENPDAEWEPIPLDRDSPTVATAIEAVDETIKHVEQSNGYANEHPQERIYVLDNLKMLSNTLKTAKETSAAYLKAHGLNVLRKVIIRFGQAVIGKLADAAALALTRLLGIF